MAFRGKAPVHSKIVIDDNPVELVSQFNFLGCDVGYEYENDISNKHLRFTYCVVQYTEH